MLGGSIRTISNVHAVSSAVSVLDAGSASLGGKRAQESHIWKLLEINSITELVKAFVFTKHEDTKVGLVDFLLSAVLTRSLETILLVLVISTSSYYPISSYQGLPYLLSTCCNFIALL